MNIYLFIALLSGLSGLLETFTNFRQQFNQLHWYIFTSLACFLIIVVGFRECGFDYNNYAAYFETLHSSFWKENATVVGVEKGYAYLNYMTGSYQSLLFGIAVTTIALQLWFIYKYSPLPCFTVFLILGVYLYPFFMGQYRQGLAISFVLWALLNRENKIIFFSLIGLASLFHISSLLALGILVVPSRLLKIRYYLIFLFIALLMNLFLGSIFKSYISNLPTFVGQKLGFYAETENFSYGLNMAMLLRLINFGILFYFKNKISNYKYAYYFINLYFISLFIYLGFGFLPQLGGRGSIYFYYFEFLLIPMLLTRLYGLKKIFFFSLFTGTALIRQFSFFKEWAEDYIPYKNFLLNLF